MKGYAGKLLRVNLSNGKVSKEEIPEKMQQEFLGGRGFAVKLLWDEVKKVDPLSEKNKIIFCGGPLTGQAIPNAGKMIIASKSPLTGGYGDGNIGTMASIHLRKAGYDVVVVEGKAPEPSYLMIEDDKVSVLKAQGLWGKNTFEAQDILEEKHGKNVGILVIGPGGENLVRYAVVMSQKGRAGGRPGMGAVMGSKNLKAVVIRGTRTIPNHDDNKVKELAKTGYAEIKAKDSYAFWVRQGTMSLVDWCIENACLPTYNFREGVFEHYQGVNGDMLERIKTGRRGCPMCTMQCGNVVNDSNNMPSELDYENVAMLGPNLGMKNLREVALLNRMADELGLDTISLGSCLGFAMEASEKGLISEKLGWGDFQVAQRLITDIVSGRGVGQIISKGVRAAAEVIGGGSDRWAMHVKGLEISAYNCYACPGMALSYGTCPIGATHKDGWIIAWEISTDRLSYGKEKAERLIELQRVRGAIIECLTICRFPFVEMDYGFHKIPEFMEAVTGNRFDWEDSYKTIGDRVYNLMRAYWVRENNQFNRKWDYPPERWFEEGPSQGKLKDMKLDRGKYDQLLSWYYELRGWDQNGVPSQETLENLGLTNVFQEMKR